MKTLLAICIAALGLSAASLNPMKVTLAIPVVAGSVELSPGECTIQQLNNGGVNPVVTIRSSAGQQTNVLVNRIANEKNSPNGVTLVFQGGRYVIDQIWVNEFEGYQVLHGE
jgi:hypothetical protein